MIGCDDLIVIHQVIPWTHNPCPGHDYTGWRMCLVNAPEDVKRSSGRQTEWVTWWKNSWHIWTTVSTQIPCIHQQFIIFVSDFGRFRPLAGWQSSHLRFWLIRTRLTRPLHGVIPGCCRSLLLPSSQTCIWRCCRYGGAIIWKHIESTDTLNSMEAIVD